MLSGAALVWLQVDFMSFKKNAFGTKTATRETKEKKWQVRG